MGFKTLSKDACGCKTVEYGTGCFSRYRYSCEKHADQDDMDVVPFKDTPDAWQQLIVEWSRKKMKLQQKIARIDVKIKDAERQAKRQKFNDFSGEELD